MTNEEAIKLLLNATYSDEWQGNEDLTTAHNMAIKALEEQSTLVDKIREDINNLTVYYTTKDKRINLISQRAVNRVFDKYRKGG